FAAAGRVRQVVVATATATAATIVAGAWLLRPSKVYWTSIVYDTKRVGNVNANFNNSMRRFVSWLHLPATETTLVWIAASIVLSVIVVHRVRAAFAVHNPLAAYTIAALGSYLVSPISWGHHLIFLAPAVMLVVGNGKLWWRWLAAVPAAIVV